MKISLYSRVRVKLTDYGKAVHHDYFDAINKGIGHTVIKDCDPKVDNEGYTGYVLNEFMSIFGACMYAGQPIVVEDMEMEVCDSSIWHPGYPSVDGSYIVCLTNYGLSDPAADNANPGYLPATVKDGLLMMTGPRDRDREGKGIVAYMDFNPYIKEH